MVETRLNIKYLHFCARLEMQLHDSPFDFLFMHFNNMFKDKREQEMPLALKSTFSFSEHHFQHFQLNIT